MYHKGNGKKVIRGIKAWLFFLILWAILGYFFYGGKSGVLAMIILWTIYGLTSFFALIPFCGITVQGLIVYFLIWPQISVYLVVEKTFLTGAMFWFGIVFGFIVVDIIGTLFLENKESISPI